MLLSKALDQPVDIYNKWCDEVTNVANRKNLQDYEDDEDDDGGLDIDADVDENDIPETEFWRYWVLLSFQVLQNHRNGTKIQTFPSPDK